MLQHFHILTLTHRESDLKDIGRLVTAFDREDQGQTHLLELRDRLGLEELFYVGTCNRVTLMFTFRGGIDDDFRTQLLPESSLEDLRDKITHYRGIDAIDHLLGVAASIDSLVIGERQILGQLREAYDKCRNWGLTGDDLRIVFDRTVVAAKDVYANTRIGEKSVSIVSLAVRQMMSRTPRKSSRVLLIGAGQTNILVGKFLKKYDYHNVTVFNRNLERAEQLAAGFQEGRAFGLDQLADYKEGFDVLFVCTGAVDPLVNLENIQGLLAGEDVRDKLVIDLAVPNNVSEAVVREYPFDYVAVEHLRQLAEENMSFRGQEIDRARVLLSHHAEELENLYRQRLLERALSTLPSQIKEVRQKATSEVFAKEIETLDPNARQLMDKMLAYMEKKCIGIPMKAAREAMMGQ